MELNSGYYGTRFLKNDPPGGVYPERFVILTAYNPMGREIDLAANQQRDGELAAVLREAGHVFWRVSGGDPDFLHAEAGYGILCSQAEGVDLARRFEQEAIFWVEGDDLILVACADGTSSPQTSLLWSNSHQCGSGSEFMSLQPKLSAAILTNVLVTF